MMGGNGELLTAVFKGVCQSEKTKFKFGYDAVSDKIIISSPIREAHETFRCQMSSASTLFCGVEGATTKINFKTKAIACSMEDPVM
jgi:hypothetical protein